MDFINYWDQKRISLPFEIDGVVVKVNQVGLQSIIDTANLLDGQLLISTKQCR